MRWEAVQPAVLQRRIGVGVWIVRVHVAVAVRVEVEIRRELVAGAVAGRVRVGVRATHVLRRHRAREGRGVARLVAGGRRAIAVQVPAHRVQLGQRVDLDQAVVVRVVVRAGLLVVVHSDAHHGGGVHVAAAGGGVGHQRQLVHRVRVVVHRRDGDRLRGVPVLHGERERARQRRRVAVHSHRGVVAGDGDRDVASGGLSNTAV